MHNHNQLRCFILANGPSINKLNLSLLRNEVTIGMNASTILEEKYNFVQTYYTLTDSRFLNSEVKRPYATVRLKPQTIRYLRNELKYCDDQSIPNKTFYVKALGRDGFSFDLTKGFYFGCTTTMLALQLAVYLNFKKIYLLGLDLDNYFSDQIRFYKEQNVQEFDYFISTQIYNISNAFNILKSKNIELYHCNKKSMINPYLPYVSYDSLF